MAVIYAGFDAFLTSLVSSAYGTEISTAVNVSSLACTTRQVQDSGGFFATLCEADTARHWLEKAFRRRDDVYLVTGVKTIVDPLISHGRSKTKGGNASIQVPTTLAATAAAGIPIPLNGVLDVGFGGNLSKKCAEQISFVASGEQIFAIQYRKVHVTWFSRKRAENARLEAGNRWKTYLGTRGTEEDEEDVLEARLSEHLQEEDFDGEEYEYFVVGDEEYLYPGTW